MKKNVVYIVLAVIGGLLAGYLIFGESSNSEIATEHDHRQEMVSGETWTCAMHPQIMKPEPGNCPICGMVLIPAESGHDGLATGQFKMTKNALALANIRTTKVGSGASMDNILELTGKIRENESKTETQPAHYNGRIEKLYIHSLGEKVSMGQAIAKVYSPELVAAQQELITAYNRRESRPELYEAVRNKFKNWQINGSQLSEIETTGKVRPSFTIYSHVSGIVTEIVVNEGAHVMNGHPIFKVADLKTVWAVFDTYENQVALVKKGQNIDIKAKAYPDTKFSAKISFIDPVLNASTRTVEVRAVLDNAKGQLKPGMFVAGSVALTSNTNTDTMVIPESAVLWTGERSVTYIKTDPEEPIFEMREITVGDAVNGGYIVLSGLKSGDEIVTNGTFTVDAAAQLKGKKSMMNEGSVQTMTGHKGHEGMK